MLIYVSHPFQNKESNVKKIESIVRRLAKENPDNTYISPVHTFGFMYDDFSYKRGLDMCLDLLNMCDEMQVYGDWEHSQGCKAEIAYCLEKEIPYEIKK